MDPALPPQPPPQAAATPRPPPTPWTLWFGLFAGHVAWSLHLMGSYVLVALACHGQPAIAHALAPLLHLTTLAAAALAAGAGLAAYRVWRQAERHLPHAAGDEREPDQPRAGWRSRQFTSLLGLLLSALFLYVIVLGGAPTFFVAPCQ